MYKDGQDGCTTANAGAGDAVAGADDDAKEDVTDVELEEVDDAVDDKKKWYVIFK